MPVFTTTSVLATTQAAAAAAEATAARKAACHVVLRTFDNPTSTVEQKQEFAGCVDLIYPDELSPATVVGLKVLFVLALLGAVLGVWYSRRDKWTSAGDHVMMGFIGFVFLPVAACVFVGILAGIRWLFT